MPMLYAGRAFDYISLVNDSHRLSPFLVIASAFGDEQNLTARMNMPIQLCTGAVTCLGDIRIKCGVSYIELAKPDIPRVILCGGQFAFRET